MPTVRARQRITLPDGSIAEIIQPPPPGKSKEVPVIDRQYLYDALEQELIKLGWSWRDLASLMHTCPSMTSRLKYGKLPNADTVFRLFLWLDRPLEEFIKVK